MKYPHIDPVFFQIGPLQFRWYGLMYIIGFACAYLIVRAMAKKKAYALTGREIEDLFTFAIAGLIIGARVGYCLFYNFGFYITHPLKIFAVWEGGMSFHGGLIGLIIAGVLFSRLYRKPFLMLTDMGALAATPGLFFGRMGNFINGELYGRVTDAPWGMVFPGGGILPRHPSQLYEAFSEGILLFLIILFLSRKERPRGFLLAAFLICYGVMRFIIEYFREPDTQLGYLAGTFTMGQVLCLIMIAVGSALMISVLKSGMFSRDNKQ